MHVPSCRFDSVWSRERGTKSSFDSNDRPLLLPPIHYPTMQSLLQKTRLGARPTSSIRCSSSFASRSYPGLYFHPAPSPSSSSSSTPTYSLSFLPSPAPSLSFSPTTIGQLSNPKTPQNQEPEILPRYFQENPQFLDLVHEVLREEVAKDLWVQSLAKGITSSSLEGGVDTFM